MDLHPASGMDLHKEEDSSQEPSLHDSSLIIDNDKEHCLVPTSDIGSLYHVEEDPARPSLQVPVYLFANTSIEEVDTKVVQTHTMAPHDNSSNTDILFSHDDMKVQMINTIGDHIENPESSELIQESNVPLPHLLRTIGTLNRDKNRKDSPQQVITIIEEEEEDANSDDEENMSEVILRHFVVDAGRMQSSDKEETNESDITERNDEILLEPDESEDHEIQKNAIIFSKKEPPHLIPKEMTVTLRKDNETPGASGGIIRAKRSDTSSERNSNSNEQCSLHMECEVIAEISQDGQIHLREIKTQTGPQRKHRKRKLKDDGEPNELANEAGAVEVRRSQNKEKKKFKCERCNLKCPSQERLDVHMRCHRDSTKMYTCYFCEHTEAKWVKMYQHLFTHGVEKPHACPQCSFSCFNRSDLTSHMIVHSTTKNWHCDKCGRPFKHRRNAVAHERTCRGLDESGKLQKLEVDEKFMCSICQKMLSNKRNLEKHMEIHTDIKPFVCDLCGHSTRLKESLIMHKRLHTGEKPFKCDKCSYATPDKSSLRRHKRLHTNEKPYKCDYCSYSCIQKHCLNTHVRRKHTGEQFVCGLCHYATHDRYGLNQHFKRHQNVNGELEVAPEVKTTNSDPTSTSTLICLPSGSVVRKTIAGNDTIIEDTSKTQIHDLNQVLLRIDNELPSDVASKDHQNEERDIHSTETPSSEKSQVATIELTRLETELLQQIQQPGDEVLFLKPSGEIVIRRQDGHLIVIQQQEGDENSHESSSTNVNGEEYLTSVTPATERTAEDEGAKNVVITENEQPKHYANVTST